MGNYLLVPSSMKVVWHLSENTGCFSSLATHPSSHLWVYRWVQWDLPQRGQAWSLGMTWAWHACSQFSMTLYFYHLSLDKISYHGSLFVFRLIGIIIQHNSRVFSFFLMKISKWLEINFKKIKVLFEYLQRTLVQLINISQIPTKNAFRNPSLESLGSPVFQVDAILPSSASSVSWWRLWVPVIPLGSEECFCFLKG